MLSDQMLKILNSLIQIEHNSSTIYLAMSPYMSRLGYTGMAKWLLLQSEEERKHMLKLVNYVVDRDGKVEIQALPNQAIDYGTPFETFQRVLEHEQFVTNAYRKAIEFANQTNSQTAVLFQEFLKEQVEEEAQSKLIVDRMKLAGSNPVAIILIDQELGQRQ
jgi:ferritin